MKKTLVVAAVAVAMGGLAGIAAAQAKPDVLVKQRQSAMTLIGKYWGPIAGMASGKVSPYNADVVARNATYLENLAQMPWDGFHDSTKDEKTPRAAGDLVRQKAKFDELAQRLQSRDRQARPGGAREGRGRREAAVRRRGQGLRRLPRRLPRQAVTRHAMSLEKPRAGGAFSFCCSPRTCAFAQGDAKRGEYLSKAGGCLGCHTIEDKDGEGKPVPYAGGRALKTPFGTFYGPNITPHPQAGIGRWREADFIRAMREGRRPDGAHYFPSFPYPSFTLITDADLRDLWAYLRSLPPSSRASQPHELGFFYRWRFHGRDLEVAVLHARPNGRRCRPEPGAESRRLPRQRARPLRRVPYAAQFPRRHEEGPLPRRARRTCAPNLTPTRLKNWGDDELRNFLHDRADRRRRRPGEGPWAR